MKALVKLCCSCLLLLPLWAQASVIGEWKTKDDKTGEIISTVEVFERNGRLFGKITALLREKNDVLCEQCTGDLHNQPVVGMEILQGLSFDKGIYSGGEILDPGNGKNYRCKLWLNDDGTLSVRGYIGFLFRTQIWYRN